MDKDKLSRKEKDKLRRKREILLAAQKCFAEKGYHECTMDDIARQYECSVGSLYNFFDGKDQIYKAIFQMHADKNVEFRERLNIDTEDPLQAISDYILARLEHGFENQDFIRMFLRIKRNEDIADPSLWQETILPTIQDIREALKNLVTSGIEKGVIRGDIDIFETMKMIEYQIFRVMDEALCLGRCHDMQSDLTLVQRRDIIIDVLFNGIKK